MAGGGFAFENFLPMRTGLGLAGKGREACVAVVCRETHKHKHDGNIDKMSSVQRQAKRGIVTEGNGSSLPSSPPSTALVI